MTLHRQQRKRPKKQVDENLKRAEIRAKRKMRKRGRSGTKKLLNQRAREQSTAKAFAATWQELMPNFSGFDVNGGVDEKIQLY
jgi:Flp pilus assembly protein TadB